MKTGGPGYHPSYQNASVAVYSEFCIQHQDCWLRLFSLTDYSHQDLTIILIVSGFPKDARDHTQQETV